MFSSIVWLKLILFAPLIELKFIRIFVLSSLKSETNLTLFPLNNLDFNLSRFITPYLSLIFKSIFSKTISLDFKYELVKKTSKDLS